MQKKPERVHFTGACVMVDPSNFTPPYDQQLVSALHDAGLRINWLGRSRREDDPFDASGPLPEPFFYRFSESLGASIPRAVFLFLKSFEHAFDLLRLVFHSRKKRVRIVHFQWTPVPILDYFAILALQSSSRVVLTIHDSEIFHGNASHALQRLGWKKVMAAADHLIVHTESAKAQIEASGGAARRVSVIHHPVFPRPDQRYIDRALSTFSKTALGLSEERVNFLLFGRLAAYKGLDILLDALGSVDGDVLRRIRVAIVGRPAFDAEAFAARIDDLALADTVEFRPKYLGDDELTAYLAQSDVALFPYTDIDASGALMQAIAYSPAIIASRIGIFEELLGDRVNALLVPPADHLALATAISLLAVDSELRRDLRQGVSKVAEQDLSWGVAARRTLEVYAAVASDQPGGQG